MGAPMSHLRVPLAALDLAQTDAEQLAVLRLYRAADKARWKPFEMSSRTFRGDALSGRGGAYLLADLEAAGLIQFVSRGGSRRGAVVVVANPTTGEFCSAEPSAERKPERKPEQDYADVKRIVDDCGAQAGAQAGALYARADQPPSYNLQGRDPSSVEGGDPQPSQRQEPPPPPQDPPLDVAWQAMEAARAEALGCRPTPWAAVESPARRFVARFGLGTLHGLHQHWARGQGYWAEVLRGERAHGQSPAKARDWLYVLDRMPQDSLAELVAQASAGSAPAASSDKRAERAFLDLRNMLAGCNPTSEVPGHWLDALDPVCRFTVTHMDARRIRDGRVAEVFFKEWMPLWRQAEAAERGAA